MFLISLPLPLLCPLSLCLSISLSLYLCSNAILSLDERLLTTERVAQLLKMLPSKEDAEAIEAFDGDRDHLGMDEMWVGGRMRVDEGGVM